MLFVNMYNNQFALRIFHCITVYSVVLWLDLDLISIYNSLNYTKV